MGTGTKIAIGCLVLAGLAAAAVTVGIGLGVLWVKDRVEEAAAGLEPLAATAREIQRWEKRARAHPFERPAEGVVAEPRLLRFLNVRRAVHAVYERHWPAIEALGRSADDRSSTPRLAGVLDAGGQLARMGAELRLAQVKALDAEGMSEAEYRFIQKAVYHSAWASLTEQETGRVPAEVLSEAAARLQKALRAAAEAAREEGVPGAEQISSAKLESMDRTLTRLGADGAELVAVPPANEELFRRHEAEIRKYAMHGLAFVGL
jgi:hypothetical protein